jgi:hypothetical protein
MISATFVRTPIVPVSDHFVQFFDAEDQLINAMSRFVQEGIESAEVCVAITTEVHRAGLERSLRANGLDPAALESAYQYIAVDARSMLTTFLYNQWPDRHRFHDRVGLLLTQAASRGQPVRVAGEMVALLAQEGPAAAVLELEELWNELSRVHDFVLFCAYPRSTFHGSLSGNTFDHLCAIHTHVVSDRRH